MKRMLMLALLALSLAGCDRTRGMDTKTYPISRLTVDEALALLTPYISEGGYLSGKGKFITVREKPERQTVIANVLREYDGSAEALDVVLNFQVIQADGFTEKDPAIADVEGTLREMFKYQGYKLIGAAQIRTREDEDFQQQTDVFGINGHMQRVRKSGTETRVPVTVRLATRQGQLLQSTVTATLDKPIVLGQSVGTGAVILVIRPTLAK